VDNGVSDFSRLRLRYQAKKADDGCGGQVCAQLACSLVKPVVQVFTTTTARRVLQFPAQPPYQIDGVVNAPDDAVAILFLSV
jgi:hypothetical protein